MKTSRITPLPSRRRNAMPRPLLFLLALLLIAVLAIVFLSSQAREVPVQPIEVDVTNAAGR
jgi:preprotein translocase subunit SecY